MHQLSKSNTMYSNKTNQSSIIRVALLSCMVVLLLEPVSAQIIALTHANIVSGDSEEILTDVTLLIEGEKIRSIQNSEANLPEGAEVIDLAGKYILPGFIDSHVHIRNFGDAERALLSGVTTVRNMGAAHFADVGMRELAAAGVINAPEILAAGYHVRPEPDPAFFMDFPELSSYLATGIRSKEAVKAMGEAMVSRNVDWIKTNATARAGLPQTDPWQPYYNEEEMRTLVETGAAKNIPVAAHAHGDAGGRAAVVGGAKSIEHGTYLSETTLSMMAEKGTYLVPTIAVVSDLTLPGGDYDNPLLEIRGRHMLPRVREMASNAYKLGVNIIAATDTGYGPESTLRLSMELEELTGIGMTAFEAIRSATSGAATFLDIDDHTGTIKAGLDADLLVVERNPLEQLRTIRDPLLIVNNGKVVLNRLNF